MKSPRFAIRSAALGPIFHPENLQKTWRKKVRVYMRQQFMCDGIENFDFHVAYKAECIKISQSIMAGTYVPQKAKRILVEKGKGLCRQLVLPSVQDALVLQCLSDALFKQIRGKAPTNKAFYQPQENKFSSVRSEYGTFTAWLNFQKELFNFSKSRKFIVVTDIANYYDNISYLHLRNVISSITDVDECIIDMLVFILSELLWQPDYTPRVEVGLPQINLDAPRLLAHCFLYELDAFLNNDPNRDFVRYMDDIDVGVDTIVEAKRTLREIDLVLHTRQMRLNSGKTLILNNDDALKHFRVVENANLDRIRSRVERRLKMGMSIVRDRKLIELRIYDGLRKKKFDEGNGEKILKRWVGLAGVTDAIICPEIIEHVCKLRPALRETVFAYVRKKRLTPDNVRALINVVKSQYLVDEAGYVDMANNLVETLVTRKFVIGFYLNVLIGLIDETTYYGFYTKLWLQSKYASTRQILLSIKNGRSIWLSDERLGRLIGAMRPLFVNSVDEREYDNTFFGSYNSGFRETYVFHRRLARDVNSFNAIFDALKSPNKSRGTGITHPKFLCMISALSNLSAPVGMKNTLITNNVNMTGDIFYRGILQRLKIIP
jgi:hypothetical protein